MQRLRHRPSHFFYRGDRLAFHRLQDGTTLARLDPYLEGEQVWLLHSGRDIAVTAAEVRDISKQVHGLDLPATRPEGGSCNCGARLDDLEQRLAALETQPPPAIESSPSPVDVVGLEEDADSDLFDEGAPDPRDARIAELEALLAASPPPSPAVAALEEMERVKAKLDEGRAQVPADLVDALRDDDVSTPESRSRTTERLNIEKAELRRERAAGDMPTDREKQVDRLLNWLAQFGEA